MSPIDPLSLMILTKAIDFLFEGASKTFDKYRQGTTSKEEVLSWKPQETVLNDNQQEIDHYREQILKYRQNKRIIEKQIADYGGTTYAPLMLQNQLDNTEQEIRKWYIKLKKAVEDIYGKKITILDLE